VSSIISISPLRLALPSKKSESYISSAFAICSRRVPGTRCTPFSYAWSDWNEIPTAFPRSVCVNPFARRCARMRLPIRTSVGVAFLGLCALRAFGMARHLPLLTGYLRLTRRNQCQLALGAKTPATNKQSCAPDGWPTERSRACPLKRCNPTGINYSRGSTKGLVVSYERFPWSLRRREQ